MKRDIFISYSNKDRNIAFELCTYLENYGLNCWIAPRDVKAGNNFGAEIVSAIKSQEMFLLILSTNSNNSKHVASEVDCAFSNNKIIITFKIGNFDISDTLGYYLNSLHWLNAGEKYQDSFNALLQNCRKVIIYDGPESSTGTILHFADTKTIILKIDNKEFKISNSFAEFQSLLTDHHVELFSYNNVVYNIGELNDYTLGLLTGTISYNQFLTRSLIESTKNDCLASKRFGEKVENIKSWEEETRISDKAKEIIAYSFAGIIGKELGKLMAIGKEDYSVVKPQKYVEKCVSIVKRTLDLVNYALLSILWDSSQDKEIIFSEHERKVLTQKFDSPFEPDMLEQIELLYMLTDIFENPKNNLLLPIPELERIYKAEEDKASLKNVCQKIHNFQNKKYNVIDCWKAEEIVADFFKYFSFLTSYQMASIKKIGYRQIKNYKPGFVHRYIALGIDNKANVDAEKVDYEENATYSDSVLLFKGDDFRKSINLFPFILDYNAITLEQGSKICFYRSLPVERDTLEYLFIDDNNIIQFEKKGFPDDNRNINELLLNEENLRILNIQCCVDRFFEARRSILKEIDFNDL
ncbi:MAG: toll/interleukin-1 receptor domain-containing protein [Bacteroidetes bacterium]|nr:toll/interleukin-1 receptor domain-containing protein [Bacteroidota bacterium]